MPVNKIQLFWTDEDGDTRPTSFFVDVADAEQDDEGLIDLRDAAQACSNASLERVQINRTVVIDPPGSPVDGEYSIQDKCVLLLVTAAQTYVQLVCPAPIAAIFTNSDVVNTGHAAVQAVLAAAQTCVTDTFGNLVDDIVRGWRERYPRR